MERNWLKFTELQPSSCDGIKAPFPTPLRGPVVVVGWIHDLAFTVRAFQGWWASAQFGR